MSLQMRVLRVPPKNGLHTTAGEPLANQGPSPASEIGRVFVWLHLCLKCFQRGGGTGPALLRGSLSILPIPFIQCSHFIHGNPEGTVVVSRPACAWNKGLPVEGSVGKGSSSLQTLLSWRPRSRRWERQLPCHPKGLSPSGGRKQGNPLPGCGFPPCQLGFCISAVIYTYIYLFFLHFFLFVPS